MMVESIRTLVRPVVTLAFVVATIIAAFSDGDAFERLAPISGGVVSFWFVDRMKKGVK